MKKFIPTLLLASILFFISCDIDQLTTIQDTFKVTITPEAVANKKEIQVINALNGNSVNASIKLFGKYADNVYMSSGDKKIVFDDGLTVIGLDKSIMASEKNTIEVVAEISADGYLSTQKILSFNGNPLENITVLLLERNNLPENVKLESGSLSLSENSTTRSLELETKSVDNSDLVKITIPTNTSFFNENGDAVSLNNASVTLETFELYKDPKEQAIYNVIQEIPNNLKLSDDDPKEFKAVIKVKINANGSLILPSRMVFDTENEDEDIFIQQADGTLRKLSRIAGKTNTPSKSTSNHQQFWDYQGGGNAARTMILYMTFGGGFPEPDTCNLGNYKFFNIGPPGKFMIKVKDLSNGNIVRTSFSTLYAGEKRPLSFAGGPLDLLASRKYSIEVSSIEPNSFFPIHIVTANGNCDLFRNPNSVFNIFSDKRPSELLDIPFKIDCPKLNLSLNETTVYFKENNRFSRYGIYGKVENGQLSRRLPTLNPEKEYIFKFFYKKNRETEPIKGKDVKTIIEQYNKQEICDLIESEL